MGIVKNHKTTIIALVGLSIFYFLLRLLYLDRLPIFTDEAIYLRWAQIALNDPSWTFISLTDGKQPFFVWASMLFMKFIEDPLLAGRLVSVITGFFTFAGLFLLTYELFKNRIVALLSPLIYIVSPFAQVYDRMAIMDSMSGMFYLWAIYFSVLLARRVRLDLAFALGFAIGGGLLTKSSAVFSIYVLPFTLLLFNFKKGNKTLFKWVAFAVFAALLAELFYSFLRLSPLFGTIDQKNQVFIYPISEWITHPLTYFQGNSRGLITWFIEYMQIPYIILIAVSLAFIRKFPKEKILLLIYFVAPFLALALFAKVIYPRYIFFMVLPLFPIAGWGLYFLMSKVSDFLSKRKINRNISYLLIPVFLAYPLFTSFQFVTQPERAKITETDKHQYISGWPSGAGVKEAVQFFENEAKEQKIYVGTQGTFGILPHALDIYLSTNKNITIKGYWPIEQEIPEEVLKKAGEMPTYVVFYQPCVPCGGVGVPPANWPLKRVLTVQKDNINFGVYKVE